MKTEYYEQLNADLGFEFDLFAIEHDDWIAKHVPDSALIVLQTDDPGFNAWARRLAQRGRRLDDEPERPIVYVHIRQLRPQRSRILKAEAEVVAPPRTVKRPARRFQG
jgi:hypothetical protein